jgi:hypothetical protein
MKLPWLVSPAFDLAFISGAVWLLVFVPGSVTSDASTPLHFWQLYFLTTPHRWLTLLLVATDPDRRQGKTQLLIGIAVLLGILAIATAFGTGALLCLALVDFVWNGWHFASQHSGILAIYGKQCGSYSPIAEKYALRLFLFYVILRSAGWTTGCLSAEDSWTAWVESCDFFALGFIAGITIWTFRFWQVQQLPKLCYFLSVGSLYSGLLISLHLQSTTWTMRFALGSAIMHATEYLAIVTMYAWKRQAVGSEGLFREMAQRWLPLLSLFVVMVGLIETNLGQAMGEFWIGLNLWASFVHYAFDGLIWKLRHAATAKALGATT